MGELADPVDAPVAAATLAAAFVDDPLMSWLFEDRAARPAQLLQWWSWMLDHRPGHAEVLATVDDASAALWYGPDPVDDGEARDFVGLVTALLGADVARVKLAGLAVVPAAHPHHERHWYLAAVGTRPAQQGHGRAPNVLAPVLARADATGTACYLESSNARNVPFYERLGFAVTGTIEIPGGPSLTPMWRVPRG